MKSDSAIYPYPDHWKLTTLGQLCIDGGGGIQTGPFGSQLHASDYVEAGIPSIMPKNISIEGVSTENIARITEEDAQRLSKYLVKEGDIVYSRRGDVEKCSLITEKESGWLCGTGCLKVNFGNNSQVPSGYIHAYLSHPAIREWVARHAVGATMPNLNTSILSGVPVLLPPKEEIDIILSVWENTTDKIKINRQTNQTLEHIAQAIFKSWFVDFEPTRAKIAAKQIAQAHQNGEPSAALKEALLADNRWPESVAAAIAEGNPERAAMAAISGAVQGCTNAAEGRMPEAAKALDEIDQLSPEQQEQLLTTAALFPDVLVDSELGEIPGGWELGELRRIAEFTADRISTSDLTLENYISTENMLEGKKGISDASSLPTVKTVLSFKPSQILISNIRPYFMKIWLARFEGGRSNDVLGIEAKEPESVAYLYNLLYQDVFFNFMMTTSKGAKMPRGDKEAIMGWVCVQPNLDVKKAYSSVIASFYEIIDSHNKENEGLEKTRDSLLPKLLSGELSVSSQELV